LNALDLIVFLNLVCLGLTFYLIRKPDLTFVRKLFFFDASRFLMHIFIVFPIVHPACKRVQPLIWNPENLNLPPPGVATVQQWLIWWLGYPLVEFTQIDGVLLADIYTVFIKPGQAAPYLLVVAGLLLVLTLDYLWAYKGSAQAQTLRKLIYGIWLLLFSLWTLIALTVTAEIPGAMDYRNKWLFMQYWGFEPWVVATVLYGLFFSVWLPTIVAGYFITKSR